MQRHEPADLKLIRMDSFLIEYLAGLLDYTLGRTPADQGNIGVAGTRQRRRRHCGLNPGYLAHALFHHGAAFDRVGELVADQYAVFHVFVRRHRVDMAGNTGNGARGNAAVGDLVAFVSPVRGTCGGRPVRGYKFPTVDVRAEIQIFRMYAEPTFRQQQIAKHQTRTLEPVGKVEDLGDKLEAIANVQRSRDDSRIIAKSRAEHLPKVALLGLGGNARGRAGSLAVDNHHRGFNHGGHAQALTHQSKSAARRSAHGADTGVSRADRHVDHPDLILDLSYHDAGFPCVRRYPMQHARRRTHRIGAIELHTGCRSAHGHGDIATQDRVAILSLGQGIRKIRKVSRRIIVAGPRDRNVLGHYCFALFLELLPENFLQYLEADTHHVKAGANRQGVLRDLISRDVG